MKPKASRGIAIAAILAVFVAAFASCVTLPRNGAHDPEADVPGAQALVSGEDDAVPLTLGNYTWSYMNGSERRIEELRQIDPQEWHTDELTQVSATAGSTVTMRFDEEPLWAYVRSWDEEELAKGSMADSPLLWRLRTLIDAAESVGDEVVSTFEDGTLTFEVEPGRRYAISATYEQGFSGNDHIEYVFTVR